MGKNINLVIDSDKSDIVSLFISSNPKHCRSVKYYNYSNKSPYGPSIGAIAKNNSGHIIGHYSVLPLKFKYLGDCYNVGFAQQAVIHSEYRDLKLVSELHNFVIDKVAKKMDFVFAFSNNNFAYIKTKLLGWNDLGSFNSSVIDLKLINFKINHKVSSLKKFTNGFEVNKNKYSLVKTSEYLNYRLLNNPISHYKTFIVKNKCRITGYISLKFYKSNDNFVGHFIDFEAENTDIIKSLISKAKDYFLFYGVQEVVFWNMGEYKELFTPFIISEGFSSNFVVNNLSNDVDFFDKELWNLSMILSDAF